MQINRAEREGLPTIMKDCTKGPPRREIGSCMLEAIHSFTCLESEANCGSDYSSTTQELCSRGE
jgi:hypothetical protein